jgi:hypothetical protein
MQDAENSSDELAVFQAYVDLINSGRETNWARNNALLVANSLILGAMIASPTGLSGQQGLTLLLLGAGFLMTLVWAAITIAGWNVLGRDPVLALLRPAPQSLLQGREPPSYARRDFLPDPAHDRRVRADLSFARLFEAFHLTPPRPARKC